ncbi:MAG TPA: nucleotidyltransferase [Desulfobulbus sp.]|nr:nucleotidyltransferase [Desulfobulbus sp.]
MANLEHIQKQRDEIHKISSRHGARRIRIFGSVARQTAGVDSDVDFLIDLDPERSLLDLGGLKMELQDLLGCKVDLVTEKGLHWYLKDKILKEARPL